MLKPGKERVIANRHPWIFAGAIAEESGPEDAAVADLVDGRGDLVASGLYSKHSQIRLRALTFGEPLEASDLTERLRAAVAMRRRMFDGTPTHAYRVVNADGDDLSGLICDRYGDVLVVEIANAGLEKLSSLIVDTLREELTPRIVYFKNDLPARRIERLTMDDRFEGDGEPETTVVENGYRFRIEPRDAQKTGFFLDQRDNRALARDLASDAAVLNLFSFTGAFGVYAAAGGARSVVHVDVSARALDLARINHELNGSNADLVHADVFEFVRQRGVAGDEFGLVVCDPPAFAKHRGDVDRAARGYKDVNLHSLRLVAPGGYLMTFSCSGHMSIDLFQKVVFSAALDAGRRASFVRRLTAGADHPVSLYCPEGEYLKGFLVRVE